MSCRNRTSLSLLILVLAVAGPTLARPQHPEFDIQGHRGARGLAPENTLPAFERAIELGVSTLELDIQVTRDGVMVVHHDKRLNSRLCQRADGGSVGKRPLAEVDYVELSDFDCGSKRVRDFPDQELAPGARIPRLEEVLDLAKAAPYPVWVSIEIKQPVDELPLSLETGVDEVVSLVEEFGLQQRAIIQSKWGEVLAAVRDRAPDMERSLVVRTAGARRWAEDGVATIVSRKHIFLDRGETETLQRLGVRVIPWTVNRPERMQRLLSWGVDGLITDYPDRALEVLKRTESPHDGDD